MPPQSPAATLGLGLGTLQQQQHRAGMHRYLTQHHHTYFAAFREFGVLPSQHEHPMQLCEQVTAHSTQSSVGFSLKYPC